MAIRSQPVESVPVESVPGPSRDGNIVYEPSRASETRL